MTFSFPALQKSEIHVWKIQCPSFSQSQNKILGFQTSQEIQRAKKFYQTKDQICSLVTRASVRKLLGFYLNLNSLNIEFEYNAFGKPSVKAEMNPFRVEFNLSHSENSIVMAFSQKMQIGIDVEYIKPMKDMDEVAKIVFSPKEFNAYAKTSEENKNSFFYNLWTRKEALIKALGTGFSYETKNFTIDLTLKNGIQIIELHDKDLNKKNNWDIRSLDLYHDNKVAIACEQKIKKCLTFELVW